MVNEYKTFIDKFKKNSILLFKHLTTKTLNGKSYVYHLQSGEIQDEILFDCNTFVQERFKPFVLRSKLVPLVTHELNGNYDDKNDEEAQRNKETWQFMKKWKHFISKDEIASALKLRLLEELIPNVHLDEIKIHKKIKSVLSRLKIQFNSENEEKKFIISLLKRIFQKKSLDEITLETLDLIIDTVVNISRPHLKSPYFNVII